MVKARVQLVVSHGGSFAECKSGTSASEGEVRGVAKKLKLFAAALLGYCKSHW